MPGDRWWASDQRDFSLVAAPGPVQGGLLFASNRYADLARPLLAGSYVRAAVEGAWERDDDVCRRRSLGDDVRFR